MFRNSVQWLGLIPALPLLAAGAGWLLGRGAKAAWGAALVAAGLSVFLSVQAWDAAAHGAAGAKTWGFDWLRFAGGAVELGWVNDPLSAVMLLAVSVVGFLVFVYAVGYMEGEPRIGRFFAYLSLFLGAMLGVVAANSLLLLFMCWELMGLASYLLIGFWFEKPAAARAARKAFLVTRIGDAGLLLGLVWLHREAGTLLLFDNGAGLLEGDMAERLRGMAGPVAGWSVAGAIGFLVFCGAAGKSGQFPLHIWLPDAMEGPTPVSALIHAATMVAAGVFLMVRLFPLVAGTPVPDVMAWAGLGTALFAGVVALGQRDFKRVLAYSTISQLGFMMMGVGCAAPGAAMHHLITHAFFKALLFLAAGSVIHACGGEQDIFRMGGLWGLLKKTSAVFLAGFAALTGAPVVTSGFWSKDGLLAAALHHGPGMFALAVAGVFLTALYMTRLYLLVFRGQYRGAPVRHEEGHGRGSPYGFRDDKPVESPGILTWPMALLAVMCLPVFWDGRGLVLWLAPGEAGGHGWVASVLGAVAWVAGLAVGARYYAEANRGRGVTDPLLHRAPWVFGWLERHLGVDAFVCGAARVVTEWAGRLADLGDWILAWAGQICAGVARGVGRVAFAAGDRRLLDGGFFAGCSVASGLGRFAGWLHRRGAGRLVRLAAAGMAAGLWILVVRR